MIISEFHHFIFYKKRSLATPATSTWYQGPVLCILGGSQKPRVSNVFLLEDPLTLRLRRYKAPGPAASCWGGNISKKVLGHLPTCYQQHHPHQVAAMWWCRGKSRPFTARNAVEPSWTYPGQEACSPLKPLLRKM
ncbi:uncharacterized protein TM35_000063030 [Trypanosoma theileri]|uniref:Tbingi protein n=1 Tax=Trypanosoma theileri TaxID=67003 RepID=A0A1X0P3B1_9TRYP|nr:uncharacterized protein TM35_000063030 [Trypanosoma theileri]ORC91298.1 hypothetical protein TM35_000063030 [Trypanosoma theileri]